MSVVTAILVFAQPVAHDATRKHLSAQASSNYRAVQLLNERVRQTACQTGLPVLFSTDLITHSGSFGEQLSEALHAVFGQGIERVLVVGNDCPALTAADLTGAVTELQQGCVVLGSDTRGGLYLLGLSREQFNADTLSELPWQTNRLHRAVQAYFVAQHVVSLRVLGDINRAEDIRDSYPESTALNAFIRVLLRLIDAWAIFGRQSVSYRAVQPVIYRTGPLRAPPTPAYRIVS